MVKTKNPITTACPALLWCEERNAMLWIPAPRAAADDVAAILFKPFPRVAPIEDEKQNKTKTLSSNSVASCYAINRLQA